MVTVYLVLTQQLFASVNSIWPADCQFFISNINEKLGENSREKVAGGWEMSGLLTPV